MNENLINIEYSSYAKRVDLTGRDLLSLFGKTIEEVKSLTGLNISVTPDISIKINPDKVTSMSGEIADEVHEWPNANQGATFRRLSLHFKDGKLISLEWRFSLEEFIPKKKPWYRKWL